MNNLFCLAILAFLLTLCGCSPEKHYPSQSEISNAHKIALDTLINDQNAVMIDWYRSRLTPSHDVEFSYESFRFPRKHYYYDAEPSVWPTPLAWIITLISLIAPIAGGWFHYSQIKYLYGSSDEIRTQTLNIALISFLSVHFIAFVAILPLKAIVHMIWPSGMYIPWHYSAFIGYALLSILAMFAFGIYLSRPLLASSSLHMKQQTLNWLARRRKIKIIKETKQSQLQEYVSAVMENVDLLTGNEEEDTPTLLLISEYLTKIRYDEEFERKKKIIYGDLSVVARRLQEIGYGEKAVTRRLEHM